jgi:LmbE family N-acetylglucosaminyl deacetylase
MAELLFHNPGAVVWTSMSESLSGALGRATHLGIGAHHDDLEFMAFEGIAACYGRADRHFVGVTCADGRGSARGGDLAGTDAEALAGMRITEQETAAKIGGYSAMVQLGYPSTEACGEPIVDDLARLLSLSSAEVIYTHNPADKHRTHLAVFSSVLKALRSLPPVRRPQRFIGCEVWRDLDWMPDSEKIRMDVSGHEALAERLNAVFVSQIAGGKRYDLAVPGRRSANATFSEPRAGDNAAQVIVGMDLSPLLRDDSLDPVEFTCGFIRRFEHEVSDGLGRYFSH